MWTHASPRLGAGGRSAPTIARLHDHAKPLDPGPAANLEAYRAYLRGRYLRHTKNDHGPALAEFEAAVRLDPAYAPAWVGVAEANVLAAHYGLFPTREACARARAAAATAHGLQGDSPEALYVLGMAAFLERDWAAAEASYRRALAAQPRHVLALGSFGLILSARGRAEEALQVFERAREADPLAAIPYAISGAGIVILGRPREAERHFEDALGFERENTLALWAGGMGDVALGQFECGIGSLRDAARLTMRAAFHEGLVGWGLARAGRVDEARLVLAGLQARPSDAPVAVSEAWLLAALGESDAAFEVIERALRECQAFAYYVGLPGYDELRADPRFAALRERLGLPAA